MVYDKGVMTSMKEIGGIEGQKCNVVTGDQRHVKTLHSDLLIVVIVHNHTHTLLLTYYYYHYYTLDFLYAKCSESFS